MSFFSRLILDSEVYAQKPHFLQSMTLDSYREHQLLWQCFDTDKQASRDFIFRREMSNGRIKYYVVSKREPSNCDFFEIESKPYEPQLKEGQTLAFSLRVNPIISKRDNTGKQKRHDVVMDAKFQASQSEKTNQSNIITEAGFSWLQSRAPKQGFSIDKNSINIDGYQQHRGYKYRQKTLIRYSTLDYSGHLKVTDPTLFNNTLLQGIGPAKAFGCGLLLVRRI